ncbi:MAG: RNA polymerase sigma factor [Myxococcota bacterium]
MPAPPSPDLLAAARRGSGEARDALIDAWLPSVVTWCARLGGPRVDPEDAAHDVFIVVLTRLDGLREPERFPSWVFGITRRVLAQHRRRAWWSRWVPGAVVDAVDPGRDPDEVAALSETSRRVQAALEELPEAQRTVLILCDLEERADSEVADLLDCPLGTVRSRLRLARERFRRVAPRYRLGADVVSIAGGRR